MPASNAACKPWAGHVQVLWAQVSTQARALSALPRVEQGRARRVVGALLRATSQSLIRAGFQLHTCNCPRGTVLIL